MGKLTRNQIDLFNSLHESRAEDFKTFNKRSWRGIWNSVIDKYPESAHFVYELLQNADDAEATEVKIIVKRNELLFKHNGTKHFDITPEDAKIPGDINSITGIGDSSKTETQNKIGKFGVGFKAVFQYTDTPEIYDDIFKFKIENYIIPTLLEYDHPERKEGETLFVFPFKNGEKSYQEILKRLENLENPILFLRNLQKITLRVDRKTNKVGEERYYIKDIIEKIEYDEEITLERIRLTEPSGIKHLFLFSQPVIVDDDERELPISVGFYYNESTQKLITDIKQNIFCFFPTKESFGTCFVSHAPFLLTDNRQNLKPDEKYNKDLIQFLCELAGDAIVILRDYGVSKKNLLIDENIFEIIPKYTHNYWRALDELFEEPMKDELRRKLETEPLLLSRNNKYLKIKDAIIGTPRELMQLLSQEQLSYLLSKESGNVSYSNPDFLKWDLAQKIANTNYDMYNGILTYSSERFGKAISSTFMNGQDPKWVTRLYTFLRTAAPKLWKVAERGKTDFSSLVFRNAPIIKTQNGEWVAPYIDGKVLNVYFPLKKNTSSGYNFISDEYLSNEIAMRFFRELEIKEPNELDYIQSVILSKFRGDEFEIDDEDIISDFEVLYEYYRKVRGTEEEQTYISLLKNQLWLVGDDDRLNRPNNLYLRTPFVEEYFDIDEITLVDTNYYSKLLTKYSQDSIEEFFVLLGVCKYPQIKQVEKYGKWQISSPTREQISTVDYSETKYYDYETLMNISNSPK